MVAFAVDYSSWTFADSLKYTVNLSPKDFHFDERLVGSTITPVIGFLVLYHILIRILPKMGKGDVRSKPFEMLHNGLLAVVSLIMAVNMYFAAVQRHSEDGPLGLWCTQRPSATIHDGPIGYWTYIFYLTKYWELVDTLILAARKKPMIFLHVFHHTVMVFGTWAWLRYNFLEAAWWCVFVNSIIHTFMYSYYFLSVVQSRPPWWGKYLTQAQIVQFLTGMVFIFYWINAKLTSGCTSEWFAGLFSLGINIAFISLFVHFYRTKEARKKAPKVAAGTTPAQVARGASTPARSGKREE